MSLNFWIYELGTSLGSNRIQTSDLLSEFGPVREGFTDRTGFINLYSAGEDTALSLSVGILKNKIKMIEENTKIGTLIFVGSSTEYQAPGNASLLHDALKLDKNVMTVDINDACTGFLKALLLTGSIQKTNQEGATLLVISDTYRKFFEESNLKLSPLFSDGCSAFLVSTNEVKGLRGQLAGRNWEVLGKSFATDGSKAQTLRIERNSESPNHSLQMDGAAVFQFVLGNAENTINQATQKIDPIQRNTIQWFVHQGSRAVVNAMELVLGAEPDSLLRAREYGNVVGSSLPFQFGDIKNEKNQLIGMISFGVGLSMICVIVNQIEVSK